MYTVIYTYTITTTTQSPFQTTGMKTEWSGMETEITLLSLLLQLCTLYGDVYINR